MTISVVTDCDRNLMPQKVNELCAAIYAADATFSLTGGAQTFDTPEAYDDNFLGQALTRCATWLNTNHASGISLIDPVDRQMLPSYLATIIAAANTAGL